MQKYLFIILGFLGMIFLIELGVFFWQKNTPLSSLSISLSPTIAPKPHLPMSQQNKKGIQLVNLGEDYTKAGFIGWNDKNFFYMVKKENYNSIFPFSFIGIVKKLNGRKMEIETTGGDKTTYLIKIELLPNGEVIKTTKNDPKQNQLSSIQEIKIGNKVRVTNFSSDKIQDGYFLIKRLNLFPT
jgi:hypothetical protein